MCRENDHLTCLLSPPLLLLLLLLFLILLLLLLLLLLNTLTPLALTASLALTHSTNLNVTASPLISAISARRTTRTTS